MQPHRHPPSKSAFTLIEALVVICILAILIAITVPALSNISAATQLTQTGDLVVAHLSDAQQRAIATDSEVEVRIYENQALDQADPTLRFRALQTLVLQPIETDTTNTTTAQEATFQPITSLIPLSPGYTISSKEKLNSLLTLGFTTPSTTTTGETSDHRYLAIRFLPDGSTNLPPGPTTPWFLTIVVTESEITTPPNLIPPNFYTLQIDPITGRLRTFRP